MILYTVRALFNKLSVDPLKLPMGACMAPWLGLLNVYVTVILHISIRKKIMRLEGLNVFNEIER